MSLDNDAQALGHAVQRMAKLASNLFDLPLTAVHMDLSESVLTERVENHMTVMQAVLVADRANLRAPALKPVFSNVRFLDNRWSAAS